MYALITWPKIRVRWSLKKNQHGNVILGNNAPTKVLGKGRAKINKHRGATDNLLVQVLK